MNDNKILHTEPLWVVAQILKNPKILTKLKCIYIAIQQTTLLLFLPVRMSAMHRYIAAILRQVELQFKYSLCQNIYFKKIM